MVQYVGAVHQYDMIVPAFEVNQITMFRKTFRYMDSGAEPDHRRNTERQSLQRIRRASIVILVIDAVIFLWCLLSCIRRTETMRFLLPAFAAVISGTLLYRNQNRVSARAAQMEEYNRVLNEASRHDALTGLLNRLALETDAGRMDGRNMTAYMIDINYSKRSTISTGTRQGTRCCGKPARF